MDRTVVGVLGAISSLGSTAQAAAARDVSEVLSARSYAELVQPIPNALALLEMVGADDAQRVPAKTGQYQEVQVAQYYHHHHHHHYRHHHHHHHHHHHYDGY